MHLDDLQLASYLDLPSGSDEHRRLRAHVLACARCSARVARLREDERRIANALSGPAPDVRAMGAPQAGRARPWQFLARGAWFSAALASALLFAALLGVQSGTLGFTPDRLFIADRARQRVVALNAADGATVGQGRVESQPTQIAYDALRRRVYVLTERGVVALDEQTLAMMDAWAAPVDDRHAGMALDPARARLYVAGEHGITTLALDRERLVVLENHDLGGIGALALAPDGGTIFALGADGTMVWHIDIATGITSPFPLSDTPRRQGSTLAPMPDGTALVVFLQTSLGGEPPAIWRIDVASGSVVAKRPLAIQPPPWDIAVLDRGQIAISRGDGSRGGIELRDGRTLESITSLGPDADEHQLAPGSGGVLFALNWLHGTVARYDTQQQTLLWRTPQDNWQPWEAVFVPGGWWLSEGAPLHR